MAQAYFTNRGITFIISEYFTSNNVPTGFKLALCAKQNDDTIDNAAAVNKGSGKVGIPVTGHAFDAGDAVKVTNTTNYDGWYVLDSETVNEVVIVATYVGETFAGTENIHEAPGPNTNTLSQLVEISGTANGYTAGGEAVARNTTAGFDSLTEDDTNNQGTLQLQNVTWTASGGSMPASGGTRYLVLVDSSANVICFWDLDDDLQVSSGQQFIAQDAEIVAGHPA